MITVAENWRYLKARLKSIWSARGDPISQAGADNNATVRGYLRAWRLRHPTADRVARIAAISLAAFLVAPYVFVLIYRFVDPPFSSLMLRQALTGVSIDRRWVDIEDISKNLPRAVIVSEDSAFCDHWGVDWRAVGEAIEDAKDGDIPRGASTIPMQTAKNLFLWPEQTYLRKVLELPLAYWISVVWPKWRVAEVYLNIAEWGPGVFGAEAAAQRYFGKPAADLTQSEALVMAAALPNPIRNSVAKPGPRLRNRAARLRVRVSREGASAACVLQ
ncbi:MAG: monofunctional biosynthetic peptidoglycan transglycosylase [Hyphomicrobiales bacterium]|nr:monofunctional biosynthetic peptidoglycan transglycosylase [Hyphomicrobiales bacterium]